MADIAAGDVAYTRQEGSQKGCPSDPEGGATFKLVFGDGSLTYPTGGIPLTGGKLGCPIKINSFQIVDGGNGNGYVIKFDYANNKLRIYRAPAQTHAHDLLIIGGQAAASTAALAWYATDILGKEAATNKTILGADSATKGGVTSSTLAAANLTELTGGSTAVTSATTMYAKVSGW